MKDPAKQLKKVVSIYKELMSELRKYDDMDSNAAQMTLPEYGALVRWYAKKDMESANNLADSLSDEFSAGLDGDMVGEV